MGFAVAIVFIVLAVVVALGAVKIVPQGREFTVERFGRYTRTLKPGISFLTPFVEGVGRRINMMEQVLDVPRQDVITKDNVSVQVDAIVFIQVMDAAAAAYRVTNLDFAITQLTMTNLRTVVGNMELDEVLSQRDQINTRLLDVIDQATSPWGVKVARIEIKDLQPPPDITNAMARQMKAERERRAVITEADGEKQAAIARAEGAKQAAILEAEGRKEAAFRDAEARERAAGAEAEATRLVSDAIAAGDVNAINYFVAQKYVEAFGKLAESPQQRTVIVPAEMGSLVGTISGISELVRVRSGIWGRAAFGSDPAAPAAAPAAGADHSTHWGLIHDRTIRAIRSPPLLDLGCARRRPAGGGGGDRIGVDAVAGRFGWRRGVVAAGLPGHAHTPGRAAVRGDHHHGHAAQPPLPHAADPARRRRYQ